MDRISAIELSTPVVVTIQNETSIDRSVSITAETSDESRGTYDEAVVAPAGHTTNLGHMSNISQFVTVRLFEPAVDVESDTDVDDGEDEDAGVTAVEDAIVTDSTQSLTVIVTDSDLELEIEERE